jgi:hypothetical protein
LTKKQHRTLKGPVSQSANKSKPGPPNKALKVLKGRAVGVVEVVWIDEEAAEGQQGTWVLGPMGPWPKGCEPIVGSTLRAGTCGCNFVVFAAAIHWSHHRIVHCHNPAYTCTQLHYFGCTS